MRLSISNHRRLIAVLVLGIAHAGLPAASAGEPILDPSFLERVASIKSIREDGRFILAENQARALLAEAERKHGPKSAETAASLDALVQCLPHGPNAKALESRLIAQRAVDLKRKLYGREDMQVAESLTNMAVLLEETSEVRQACILYEEALGIAEKKVGRDNPRLVPILKNMADTRVRLDDYTGATRGYERALVILQRASAPDTLALSDVLNGRAIAAYHVGDYIQARESWQQAIALRTAVYGPRHARVASIQYNLAMLLKDMHDDAAAVELLEHALDVHMQTLDDPESVLIGLDKLALAELRKRSGNLGAAKMLFDNALSIMRSNRGSEHCLVAMCLHGLGTVHMELGQHEEAQECLEEALVIRTKCLPREHYLIGYTLRWLAKLHYELGSIVLAKQLCERALLIYERALPRHRELADVLALHAALLYESGDADGAVTSALRAEAIGAAHLELVARGVEEREALLYARIRPRGLDVALQAVIDDPSNSSSVRKVWDAVIHSRALVFDQMAARSHAAALAPDVETARILVNLRQAASQLSNLSLRSTSDFTDRHAILLADARERKAAAERALASRSRAYRRELARANVGLDAVIAKMPRGSALVAFSAYARTARAPLGNTGSTPGTLTRVPHLMAFVLPPNQPVQVISLGPVHEIESFVNRWVEEIAFGTMVTDRTPDQAETACFTAGDTLRRTVWDPIESLLHEKGVVLLVPEGALHRLNFAALPISPDSYLIDAGWRLHSLSAERDVVSFSGSHPRGRHLVAVGGVDFNASPSQQPLVAEAARVSTRATPAPEPHHTPSSRTRGAQLPCRGLESWLIPPLPESLGEVHDLVEILSRARAARASSKLETTLLTGREATEDAFKATAVGKYWLHLATHGFALGSDCRIPSLGSREIHVPSPAEGQSHPVPEPTNPLLLAGLALAGAAHRNEAPVEREDGILTAEEVASMNLNGVKCVVLSSCKTGVGPVESSEGVLSLCRAFRIAGARTMVMSLWSVSDAHTRSWMRAFYTSVLEDGLGVADAAHAANATVLAGLRQAGLSTHPFYWGGFVTTGDWK